MPNHERPTMPLGLMNDSDKLTGSRRGFIVWTGVLVAAYVGASLAGWSRTLLPDEIRPLILAARSPGELLELARADIVQTPLSYFVAQAWLNVFGHSDWAAKALAMAIGIATIVVFSILARRTTPHWRFATLLFGLVYLRVGSSPNLVRMYGLLVLLIVASMLAWEVWRERAGFSRWLLWAALATAAIYTHPSALLFVGALTVTTLAVTRRRIGLTVGTAVLLATIVAWIAFVAPIYQTRGIEENVGALADDPIREAARLPFYFLTGDPPGGGSPLEHRYGQGDWSLPRRSALLLGIAFGIAGLAGVLRRKPFLNRERAVDQRLIQNFLLVSLPTGVLLLASLVGQPVLGARYLLICLPALVLLIAELTYLGGWPARGLAAVMAGWILFSAGFTLRLNRAPELAYHSARYLDAHIEQSDVMIAGHHWAIGWEFFWEWTRRMGRTEPIIILPTEQPEWLQDIVPARALDSLDLDGVRRVWFLSTRPGVTERVTTELGRRGFEIQTPDSTVRSLHFLLLFVRTTASRSTVEPVRTGLPSPGARDDVRAMKTGSSSGISGPTTAVDRSLDQCDEAHEDQPLKCDLRRVEPVGRAAGHVFIEISARGIGDDRADDRRGDPHETDRKNDDSRVEVTILHERNPPLPVRITRPRDPLVGCVAARAGS